MKVSYRENPEKFAYIMNKNRKKCKCGHSLQLPAKLDMTVCSWCGNYVFRDKKAEFQFRMKERMNNGK